MATRNNTPNKSTNRLTSHLFRTGAAAILLWLVAACGGSGAVQSGHFGSESNDLKQTSDFAVLANAAATCTDGTITGDVGTYLAPPSGSFTDTNCVVDGSIHLGDAQAVAAYDAFLAEYAALADVECDQVLTGTLDGVTLSPGVYCFDAAATLTGVLTLQGGSSDSWLFKIGTSGTGALTGTNFTAVLDGGAEACDVTWWVAEAATLTDSDFVGNVLAGAAITLTRGTFHGNAWAGASGVGDVTITGTAATGCDTGFGNGHGNQREKCNQGVGNGPESCDPGNSNQGDPTRSNDETGGEPGSPGRKGGNGR